MYFGVTSVLKFYKSLVLQKKQIQFIVITGRNKHLYTHLKEVMEELNAQDCTKLLYFVDNVEDYMHISDLIVTKPGGLTVTESLAQENSAEKIYDLAKKLVNED